MSAHSRSLTAPKFYIRSISLPLPAIDLNIRKDLLISKLMVAAGLLIPALAVIGVIPFNFVIGFIAFALFAVGGVMWLIRCGEVA
jgi:hypothetical protein